MKDIIKYSIFLFESTVSVSDFLKTQYNNIFKEPNQNLNNLFVNFTKKVDTEKNVSNLYQMYLKSNQTTFQNEVNKAETVDAINKLILDNIKYFYFSLKPIVNKLQNNEFTMQEIFSKSRDKRLQTLMSYPEDQFSNAVSEYVSQAVTPQIKTNAGLDKKEVPGVESKPTSERMMYDIKMILEADENVSNTTNITTNVNTDLVSYKKSSINWINISLFDLLKPKMTLLNQISANTSNDVDDLSRQMKGTNNDNAKKMILNKIINMNKDELEKLANSLGLSDEIGKL